MSDTALRSDLIRLAAEKPELREHLLPLLNKQAAPEDKFSARQVQALVGLVASVESLSNQPLSERMARNLMAAGARIAHIGATALAAVAEGGGDGAIRPPRYLSLVKGNAEAALVLTTTMSKKFPHVSSP